MLLEVLHSVSGSAFQVRVERHDSSPEFQIAIRPAAACGWVQLELFNYRTHATDALELARALDLASVMAGYLEMGGSLEHWSEEDAVSNLEF